MTDAVATPRTPNPAIITAVEPAGRRPLRLTPARIGIYLFLVVAALFFLLPLYVMVITSLKPMSEIRLGNIFAWPAATTIEPWIRAWSQACTGVDCNGIQTGFLNSVEILIPSVFLSVLAGSVTGYALSFWRPAGANILFAVLLLGAFIPYQVFLFPLVRMLSSVLLYGSLPGVVVVHTIFGLPVMTLLFRNYFVGIPVDLFNAARVDGAGFARIFWQIMLPMALPIIVVAVILQVTGIWNDFLFGLTFAGREHFPMTVQLNNVVNTTTGERDYNVNMAATMITALVPLVVYFASGRWFVRGIAAGAVKG